ncbi:MAG TPA: hypothetical protein VFI03_10305 [Solirubrobacterales bacterium]|nr:hypothetical protein [Solirubrobacterales bacterium]
MHFRALFLALTLVTIACAPALAKDGDIERTGTCSGASSAKLKLSPENGRIEVEFEVDQNRVGVRWNATIKRNGARAASAHPTTRAPSGSFELRRIISDSPGTDKVVARAVSPSGETCQAHAVFP